MTREQREQDLLTIKPRQFMLSLSDKDMKDFYNLAYGKGTTPEELLKYFVCNLVNGTQTRGFDERIYAEKYLVRCCYDIFPQTFLRWILNINRLDDIAEILEMQDSVTAERKYYEEHPEDPDGTLYFIEMLEKEQIEAENELEDIYQQYVDHQSMKNEKIQDKQEGIEEVKAYLQELKNNI